jgi:hypothetical protein
VEIHCALGQFGLGEDVVKADPVVGLAGELACAGTQNLLAGGSALVPVVSVIVGPPSNAPTRRFDNRPLGLEALFALFDEFSSGAFRG